MFGYEIAGIRFRDLADFLRFFRYLIDLSRTV